MGGCGVAVGCTRRGCGSYEAVEWGELVSILSKTKWCRWSKGVPEACRAIPRFACPVPFSPTHLALGVRNLLQHRLDALLKLAAVLGPRHQGAHIQADEAHALWWAGGVGWVGV